MEVCVIDIDKFKKFLSNLKMKENSKTFVENANKLTLTINGFTWNVEIIQWPISRKSKNGNGIFDSATSWAYFEENEEKK